MTVHQRQICDPRDGIITHLPALRAFALSMTRNPSSADDLVQDTIVKAWTNFDRFELGTNLRAWLFTILRNTFYSDLRKNRREVSDSDGEISGRLCVRPDHDGALAMREFLVAFGKLSTQHREVLTLVGALGFSYEEAALTVEVAVGTIKSRVCRARAVLGDLLHLQAGESLLCDVDGATAAVISHSAAIAR